MPTARELVETIMNNSRLGPLTEAAKRIGNRVYDGGTRDKDELAALVGEDPEVRDLHTHSNQRRIFHDWIKEVVRKRHIQRKAKLEDEEEEERQQPYLFDDWDAIYEIKRPMTINRQGVIVGPHTDFVKLGDFTLVEMNQHRIQMEANIKTAHQTLQKWNGVAPLIQALLEEHLDWAWRDAEKFLHEHTAADAGF